MLRLPLALLLLALVPRADAVELRQASWVEGTSTYRFGYQSTPSIPVRGAPADTDWARWAMLHDGLDYRLYAFRRDSDTELYQFAYDTAEQAYVWGYQSIPTITVTGAPPTTDTTRFAMLHDGSSFRLLLGDTEDPAVLHQFGFDFSSASYVLGDGVPPRVPLVGFPAGTSGLAALHDGTDYRVYQFAPGTDEVLLQGAFDPRTDSVAWGQRSTPRMFLEGLPRDVASRSAAMLHDGARYRLYLLVP